MSEGRLNGSPALKKAWLFEHVELKQKRLQSVRARRGRAITGEGRQGEVLGISYIRKFANVDERMDLDVLQWRPAIPFYIPRKPYLIQFAWTFMDRWTSGCGVDIPVLR